MQAYPAVMGASSQPVPVRHLRPLEGDAREILGYERVLWIVRAGGLGILLALTPFYQLVQPALMPLLVAPLAFAIVVQLRWFREDVPSASIRRRALIMLGIDAVCLYAFGTDFVADGAWTAFYFYPLLAVEATLLLGARGAVVLTALSCLVYLAQLAAHVSLGNPFDVRPTFSALAMLLLSGGFLSGFGVIARRSRADIQAMLDLTTALGQRQAERATLQLLDRQLAATVGGRIRSVAVRKPDGSYEVVRWHGGDRISLPAATLDAVFGNRDDIVAALSAGHALTYRVDAWSPIRSSLSLPDWTQAVTLVPIFVDRRWVAILPVLWPTATEPRGHQLWLLYGLANQAGLALAQGLLDQARDTIVTDLQTGLPNRRGVIDDLAGFLARAERANGRVAVLYCDLDRFATLSERLGMEATDRILRHITEGLRGAVRQGDVVGRYGSDALVIVAAEASAEDAAHMARRITERIRAVSGAQDLEVSIGVATFPGESAIAQEMLDAAERAMYRAKVERRGLPAGIPVTVATP